MRVSSNPNSVYSNAVQFRIAYVFLNSRESRRSAIKSSNSAIAATISSGSIAQSAVDSVDSYYDTLVVNLVNWKY